MHLRWKRAGAGAIAAIVWGIVEPIDQRLFRSDYSDIAVLGKAFTRGPAWRPLGFAFHALNGALFGLAYHEIARRVPRDPRRLALELALLEHVAFYPTGHFVDRYHPARGEPGVPRLMSPRVFRQATVRHAVFGFVLGRLSSR
jgi:hypothetical protein